MAQKKFFDKHEIDYRVYLVTDESCLGGRELSRCVEAALEGGATLVQYRAKRRGGAEMFREAFALRELCERYSVPLLVNDRVDVALAVGAAGVHVGQGDLPCAAVRALAGDDFLIGVSAHNVAEARAAEAAGADYLGCGAVFGSSTKADAGRLGLENLQDIARAVSIPIVGIGGVNAENYPLVLEAGAHGAAIISAILASEDIAAATRKFFRAKNE